MKRVAVVTAALALGCVDAVELRREAAASDCREVAAALASRCPDGDPEEEALALDCAMVDAIRDHDALLDECVPAIRALPCGAEGPLPPACQDQIVHQ